MKRRLLMITMALGPSLATVAQTDAHAAKLPFSYLRAYCGTHAVVTGTVIAVGSDSFTPSALQYLVDLAATVRRRNQMPSWARLQKLVQG